ncbi:MAG: hypothetical protein A2Z03_12220 [Chloroflexi bacterium RBG_16_56_8]|nr:MAG: hypothetical protein A2Z03_12220 [Chloroflexi bacterium RBG_16_56_8]
MIVVDENLHDQRILSAIAAWYSGQVISVTALRPRSVIKDEAIPTLLRQAVQPTFVTINAEDFWRRIEPHRRYCIINIALPKERALETPLLLQRLFRLSEFKTKAARMGKVVRITPTRVDYYGSDRRVRSLPL